MTTSTRKTVWWLLLAVGIGGTGFFAALVAERGSPSKREILIWLWPIVTAMFSVVAPFRLRALYRLEPFHGSGLWQLSMADLLAATVFTGLNLACWQTIGVKWFLKAGIGASIFAGCLFVAGVLTAARLNFEKPIMRWLFALGYVARAYGALSVGGLVVLLIVATFFGENPFVFLGDILWENSRWDLLWVTYLFRSGLICLPFGLLICNVLKTAWAVPNAGKDDTPISSR